VDLDPDLAAVVDAVPGWAGKDVRAEVLGGGITNRNYRLDVDVESFVVHLSGRDTELLGIDREAERSATAAAHEAGVGPEMIAFLPKQRALITRFVHAQPLPAEDLEKPEVMDAVVEAIRAVHGMAPIPSAFDPFRIVRDYRDTAEIHGVRVPATYRQALHAADRIAVAFGRQPVPIRPCHNDLLNANVLLRDGRVILVDYEYAGMGDLFFDLGNFSINNGISEGAEELLLERYFGGATAAARARLKLMKIMSDFREAMWGVVQQGISTMDFDYVDYADRHFARCLQSAEDDRFGAWLDDAPEDF
jgi:aminoglycoside phosphotransferase (APT) family kinase protein